MIEPCPFCAQQVGHLYDCPLLGMSPSRSSMLYGYPVCQCCGLRYGPKRTELHTRMNQTPVVRGFPLESGA